MLTLQTTSQFRKDYKLVKKHGVDCALLEAVIDALLAEKPLAAKHKDHTLSGDYAGFRECHILPDWLLVYRIERETLIMVASRTGTHSDLFG